MSRHVRVAETRCEMSWIVMPSQTNALGTVFGGEVMAWIDVCAAISAQRFCRSDVVTASMDQLVFQAPIKHGWVAVVIGHVTWAGTTSMEVHVEVLAEDPYSGARTQTAEARLTFVALDADGNKRQVPTLLCETDEQREAQNGGRERQQARLEARARARRGAT
jgi:acyl-CoA hydrolase